MLYLFSFIICLLHWHPFTSHYNAVFVFFHYLFTQLTSFYIPLQCCICFLPLSVYSTDILLQPFTMLYLFSSIICLLHWHPFTSLYNAAFGFILFSREDLHFKPFQENSIQILAKWVSALAIWWVRCSLSFTVQSLFNESDVLYQSLFSHFLFSGYSMSQMFFISHCSVAI